MVSNLKMYARVAVFAICAASFSMGPALASASAQEHDNHYQSQDHNQNNQRDWSNNSSYQMGQREAAQDRQHNKQRKHRHHYKNDEDRQAYNAGYQNAWSHDSDQDHRH